MNKTYIIIYIYSSHYSYQSLRQHLAVELLEHILVLDVLEHHHHLQYIYIICEKKASKQYKPLKMQLRFKIHLGT